MYYVNPGDNGLSVPRMSVTRPQPMSMSLNRAKFVWHVYSMNISQVSFTTPLLVAPYRTDLEVTSMYKKE
jgi:hypothetical protein